MKRGAALETARADMASMNPDRARRLLRDDRFGPPTTRSPTSQLELPVEGTLRLHKAPVFVRTSLYNPLARL